ncbi:hypothetical protein A3F06_03040 [candidate division TM6 bacterium RIFCSPHIGHO2_12_FULL_36_22]|nr:MAG: hypothetical protein A3F06_03040 [candidate division TM6 bacterium RIFCSPHIGHO2_12_FULL_36_22]
MSIFTKRFICLCLLLLQYSPVSPLTLVYNMRVRRIFQINPSADIAHALWAFSAVPIYYRRDRHIVVPSEATNVHDMSRMYGTLLNLRYIGTRNWWFEATTGIEEERYRACGTTNIKASRGGFDDLLFSIGHNKAFGQAGQSAVYIIGGIPIHKKVTLQERFGPLVGTRFYSLGAGAELSWTFINTLEKTCSTFLQGRFLHFFNRKWFPILPVTAKIQPGNTADLLIGIQYRKKLNIFEIGYNPTLFANQAINLATEKIKTNAFVSNNIYGSLEHICKECSFLNKPLIGTGLSLSYSDFFKTKSFAWWVSFTAFF